jgi:transcription elongation factor Elf1
LWRPIVSKHQRWEFVEFKCPCCGEEGTITDVNKNTSGGLVAVCGHCSSCKLPFAVEVKNEAVEVLREPYVEDAGAPFSLEEMEVSPSVH